jgi:hypothetical protein
VRPYLGKNLHKNRTGGVTQGVGPEFKPQYCKKKKKKEPKVVTQQQGNAGCLTGSSRSGTEEPWVQILALPFIC